MEFGPVVEPLPHLRLPLDRIAWMGGWTETGPEIPRVRPFESGVLIGRNNCLGFYTHGLEKELWSQNVPAQAGDLGIVTGPADSILHKLKTVVTQYELQTGTIKRSIETHSEASLVGSSEHNILLMSIDDRVLVAFDWSGKETWKWKYQGYCNVLSTPETYVVVEMGTKLHGIDAISGKDLWQFEAEKTGDKGPQDHSSNLTPAFPSVVMLNGQLMIIVGDGRVFKRDLTTGELIKTGQTPFRGPFQVSEESVFILNKFECAFTEFNHLLMEEVNREDLKKELEQLFEGRNPLINALLVTEESLIWTTMEGTFMGLERQAKQGKRRLAWKDSLGVLMPIGVSPKASNGYMYYRAISLRVEVRIGLVCYRSSD